MKSMIARYLSVLVSVALLVNSSPLGAQPNRQQQQQQQQQQQARQRAQQEAALRAQQDAQRQRLQQEAATRAQQDARQREAQRQQSNREAQTRRDLQQQRDREAQQQRTRENQRQQQREREAQQRRDQASQQARARSADDARRQAQTRNSERTNQRSIAERQLAQRAMATSGIHRATTTKNFSASQRQSLERKHNERLAATARNAKQTGFGDAKRAIASGKASPWSAKSVGRGYVYQRIVKDARGKIIDKSYVGKSKNEATFKRRQDDHTRNMKKKFKEEHGDVTVEFRVLARVRTDGIAGQKKALQIAEQAAISKRQGLSNSIAAMRQDKFIAARWPEGRRGSDPLFTSRKTEEAK